FRAASNDAVSILRGDGCEFVGCEWADVGSLGLELEGVGDRASLQGATLISGCNFHDFSPRNGYDTRNAAISLSGFQKMSCGITIQNSTFTDLLRAGVSGTAILVRVLGSTFTRNMKLSGDGGAIYFNNDHVGLGCRVAGCSVIDTTHHPIHSAAGSEVYGVYFDNFTSFGICEDCHFAGVDNPIFSHAGRFNVIRRNTAVDVGNYMLNLSERHFNHGTADDYLGQSWIEGGAWTSAANLESLGLTPAQAAEAAQLLEYRSGGSKLDVHAHPQGNVVVDNTLLDGSGPMLQIKGKALYWDHPGTSDPAGWYDLTQLQYPIGGGGSPTLALSDTFTKW
ncbi:MAG: hypothetical protein ACREIA_25755, partial [Opitutaceae bacterium]